MGRGMRFTMRFLISLILAVTAGGAVWAWQWPLGEFRIDTGFAQPRNGVVATGIWLSAEEPLVRAAHPGELVFSRTEAAPAGGLTHGLGNLVVIEHEDGLRSMYSNMGRIDRPIGPDLAQGDVLGTVGVSGFAYGDQLGFHLTDVELQRLVNPLLILPPLTDETAPVVAGVYLARDGETIRLSRRSTIVPGVEYRLLIEAYDTVAGPQGTRRIPPMEVSITVGEEEEQQIRFETLQYRDGELVLTSGQALTGLYATETRLSLGVVRIDSESVRLAVRVEDFAGNRGSAEYILVAAAEEADL